MASEAELTSEINNISRELGPKVDWEKRIAALKQLQSVAMGAGAFPNFPDLVRLNLREQLTTQIQDRRSQVLFSLYMIHLFLWTLLTSSRNGCSSQSSVLNNVSILISTKYKTCQFLRA